MGQLTQTTTELQAIVDNSDAANVGKTSLTDGSDTTAVAFKKSGFYSLQGSSSNAPSTDRAVLISAVRNTAATGEIRYGQIAITESNGLWWNRDDGGSLGTWYEAVSTTGTQTLTNKTLTSPVLTTPQINDSAADHQYIFAGSNLAADRTITLPLLTGNDTFVFAAHTQTLTNKTLTSPTVSALTLSDASIIFEGATADDYETTLTVTDPTADRTITLPDATDTLVGRATTDTLTNKTLTSPIASGLTLSDASIVFEGATADDHETTLTVTDPTADRTITLPDSTDTLVGLATTDTLTNKTLTSPVFNTGVSGTAVLDADDFDGASATTLASSESIKAYVDTKFASGNELSEVLAAGNVTGANDIDVENAQKVQFRDSAIYINSSTDGQLDIVADTEIQIAATTIDINGAIVASGEISAASLDISGDIDVDGTTNLDIVDIDGAVDMASTLQVDGAITSSAGATITVADNSDNLTLTSTDADANAGPNFRMFRNSASPADGDAVGLIEFEGKNDAGQTVRYAGIDSRIVDASNGTEDGRLELVTTLAGSGAISRLNMDATETVFNDNSKNLDFRVETDGNVNMLFVDGEDNRIGIGAVPTDGTLHIQTASAGTVAASSQADDLVVENSGEGGMTIITPDDQSARIRFTSPSTNNDVGGATIFYRQNINKMQVGTAVAGGVLSLASGAGNESLNILSGGNITIKTVDAFLYSPASSGGTTIDAGLKFESSNQRLEFWTADAERVSIAANGAATFSSTVTSTSFVSTAGGTFTTAAGNDLNIVYPSGRSLLIKEGSETHVTVDNAGRVGIGRSPNSVVRLSVAGASTGASNYSLEATNSSSQTRFIVRNDGWAAFYKSDNGLSLNISETGAVSIAGSLSKGSGSFKIDHPLPEKTETHHLVHSFVESPQADNIYRGKVDLVDGSAAVNIDDAAGMTEGTYVLLNTNTQCFTSNESGWTAVKGSVSGNILTITAQDSCSDTISWMVVGERHDQHMLDTEWTDENGKVIVEPVKESQQETQHGNI